MCQVIYLDSQDKDLKKIVELWPPQKFSRDFVIFYPGQVPNIAILLVSGIVDILSKGQTQKIRQQALIGFPELIKQSEVASCARIQAGSVAGIVDRPTLLVTGKLNPQLLKNLALEIPE